MRKNMKFQFNEFKSEGEYDYIQIELDAILVGDVDANKIQSNGQPQIKGNVKTKEFIFTGLGYVEGNIETKKIECHSRTTIKGNLNAERGLIDGKLECEGDVSIDKLELNGDLIVSGNLKCNRIVGKGNIITKNLEVETMNLEVTKRTNIEKISGNKVKIFAKEQTGMFSKLFSKGELPFIAEIDADRVSVTNIKANSITCAKIQVEGNSDIGKKIKREARFE